jgi:serine/threonine protein kinase
MTRLLADRYELGEVVGAGGVARVHRAVDHHLEREVAVKVLDDDRARSADPSGRDRFLREARSAARLHHPHLVTVFDAGEDAGQLFLVMELVDGQSLAVLIAERAPLPIEEAVSIACQILDGLSAVHADGVVHRDVKPANVLVDRNGRVLLTDFGIAKRLDDIEEQLTYSGMVVGTPTYLAPEQAIGGRLSEATDVYLVGLVLYEMLTGRRPTGSARDPRQVRPDVPAAVAAAVARATDADPGRRFGTAQQMIDALREAPTRPDTKAFPVAAAPALATAAAGGAAATAVMSPERAARTGAHATTIALPPDADAPRRPRSSAWWLLAATATVVALVVGLLMVADSAGQPEEPALSTAVAASIPAVAPTASAPPTTVVASTAAPSDADDDEGSGKGKGNGKQKGRDKDD